MQNTRTRPARARRAHPVVAACALALAALALGPAAQAEPPTPPGVKPHSVKCDPAHPEMPCTPDPVPPPGFAVPSAAPASAAPAPATPDPAKPAPDPATPRGAGGLHRPKKPYMPTRLVKPKPKGEHPGRKPDYVKCDPNQPHMPCTPDRWEHPPAGVPGGPPAAPPDAGAKGAPEATPEGVKPRYVKCDPAHPELPCTPDVPPTLAPPN